ncbi:hypothetical protein [Candidatus Chromulinivorax destructor]|uniref:Uncharacterized protein n=1 Tax=Candidatus Chromulinivorax destructor TaxID=2066483 RepID=A0A345ZC94_9BACT|nr:hypothetical protein [Candidatus Chromulinivorax destructor]AXK60911.1 hypothetical protein C0J27_04155 [Candidatus Chromulinivorax destructor]
MKKIFYAAIFMMNIFGACNVMASKDDAVQVINRSLHDVTLELYDAQEKTVRTGTGPIFLQPGQSAFIQKSYTVQRNAALDITTGESHDEFIARQAKMPFDTSVVASIHCIFQHSDLNFTVPMPASMLIILPVGKHKAQ